MAYQKVTRAIAASDGTRISFHTHLPSGGGEASLAGRRTVLLTNGIGTSENFWRYLVDALKAEYRVVHWDYRGHGDSETAATGDYRIATQADDLIQVTEAVMASDGRPPLHVAFSMGVTVLLEAYRRRPELVPAMALLAGAADAPGSTIRPLNLPGAMTVLRAALAAATPVVPLLAPVVKAAIATPLVYPVGRALGLLRARAPREDIAEFMAHLVKMDARAYWATLRSLMAAHASDVLPTVTVPVLVMAADNDTLVPRRQVEQLKQALPHARWLAVEDAGHASLLEAGPEVAAALTAFFGESVVSSVM